MRPIDRLLTTVVTGSARRARVVLTVAVVLAAASVFLAATRLGMSTSIATLFDPSLPWKQAEMARQRDYPQFSNIIVAVVSARTPEEADATADALRAAATGNSTLFAFAQRPESSPYLQREGLLFLDKAGLQDVLDKTVDAAPFLGQLAADPSARGLFNALGLIGEGVRRGQADLGGFAPALRAFDNTLRAALRGEERPLSWENLLGGRLASLAGADRIVVVKPRLDYRAVQPGGASTDGLRKIIARLPEVRAGNATVELTGDVPLEDTEFGSAVQGAMIGLVLSFVLVVLWLWLALRRARLILPVVLTLVLGLLLTTGFAAVAVGTLNLISVAFAVLFVGIAVDFSIQFTVRFREMRLLADAVPAALALTAGRVGRQILIAGLAIAAGFLAFVPTSFRGVAELGLIAGAGMITALICTLTFLPAALALFRPAGEQGEIGIAALAPADRAIARAVWPLRAAFGVVFIAGAALMPSLDFDSNALHTQPQNSEAMRALHRLAANPITNPLSADVMVKNADAVAPVAQRLAALPETDHVVSIDSLVPTDQQAKLAMIQDAAGLLGPVIGEPGSPAPLDEAARRAALDKAASRLRAALPALPADSPLRSISADLDALSKAPDAALLRAGLDLTRYLPPMLARLRVLLSAKPVTRADIPPELVRDYTAPDGSARIQVVPKQEVSNGTVLGRFVAGVRAVDADASGPAVTYVASAETIITAFRRAALGAVAAIAAILLLCLPHRRDALGVLAPLLVSAAMTVVLMHLFGMGLNFANIIALPLLLGVGVSFNIYYVMNARAGEPPMLRSATTRAVLFSALTTGSAFGSLAVSAHPGTASMGVLLLISLGCTLTTSLVFVPVLLARRALAT